MIILNDKLSESIVKLHEIARVVEQEIGDRTLSETLRRSADQLASLSQLRVLEK